MPENNNHTNRKFEEALSLLNDAARDKKDEIQGLFSDKYEHLKGVFEDAVKTNQQAIRRFRKQAGRAIDEGTEHVEEFAEDLDEQVHKNPWAYIAGAAVGALLLGYILGASSRSNR